jgi:cytochrome oxidase Cu insertion factor (SCO1/SenC/PrrC family)
MKMFFSAFLLALLLALASFGQDAAPKPSPTAAPAPPPMKWKVGDMAPDFTLPDTSNKKVTLSEFRGKNNVVLAFFVLAFTGG